MFKKTDNLVREVFPHTLMDALTQNYVEVLHHLHISSICLKVAFPIFSGIEQASVLYARERQLCQPLQIIQIFIFDTFDQVSKRPNNYVKPEYYHHYKHTSNHLGQAKLLQNISLGCLAPSPQEMRFQASLTLKLVYQFISSFPHYQTANFHFSTN